MRRRVLVVSYFFPPIGGVGVQRTLKFVEFLPDAGWDPVVVAPRGAEYRVMDPSLLDRLDPELEVFRALCIEPAGIRAAARTALRRLRSMRTAGDRAGGPPTGGQPGWDKLAVTRPRAWLNAAWSAWVRGCFVPDEQMAWIPAAALTARLAHRRGAVDVIYSSSPPASAHLAAGLAKALTGRPWVADFRDPWVGNAFAQRRSAAHEWMEAWLERWVMLKADRVVFATSGLRARYAKRYPRRAARFVTIPNGYDRAELGKSRPVGQRAAGPFRLIYAGSVYGDRELRIFLDGLSRALDQQPSLRERLRIDFVGWMTGPNQRLMAERHDRLAPIVTAHGFVPRGEALARVRDADAALLLLADGPDRDLFVGAKLFEYIGLDRPVLAMAPPGDTRTLLEALSWGVVADPTPASVTEALLRIVDAPLEDRQADPEGRYERRRLAATLADVLEDAVRAAAVD